MKILKFRGKNEGYIFESFYFPMVDMLMCNRIITIIKNVGLDLNYVMMLRIYIHNGYSHFRVGTKTSSGLEHF